MDETTRLHRINPRVIRYIKLGASGQWFERCVSDGVIELGHRVAPHALANICDWTGLETIWLEEGRTHAKAKDFRREVQDFYTLPEDSLWITFGAGRLWWCFAEAQVTVLPDDFGNHGARQRRCIGGWQSKDITGAPLQMDRLSSRLTQVAGYRQTICKVDAEKYLIRRINCEIEPAVAAAQIAKASTIQAASQLIQSLHWADFEVLVDLIFSTSGWRRSSAVGGSTQADTDLILEQAVTGERAFVQIKSKASAAAFADYVDRFISSGLDRMFFVCHSPSSKLVSPKGYDGVHLWQGEAIASQAVNAGLLDWLIAKGS